MDWERMGSAEGIIVPSGEDNGKRTENIIKKIMNMNQQQKLSLIRSLLVDLVDDVGELYKGIADIHSEIVVIGVIQEMDKLNPKDRIGYIKDVYDELAGDLADMFKYLCMAIARTASLGVLLSSPEKICDKLRDSFDEEFGGEEIYKVCINSLKKKGIIV